MPILTAIVSFRKWCITWDMLFQRKAQHQIQKNIISIIDWETPKSVDEVKSFMGLRSYYKVFIKKLSQISYSITSCQRKGKKFEWIEGCATRFEKLKYLLTNSPTLNIGDANKEFMVCKDAYKRGLDGFLKLEGQVVCYESKKLAENENTYVTHDLELQLLSMH